MQKIDKNDTLVGMTASLLSVPIDVSVPLSTRIADIAQWLTSVESCVFESGTIVAEQTQQHGFLDKGGKVGLRIGKLDWSLHPLGPVHAWDAALRACLEAVLGSSRPSFMVWGPDLTLFFNDAYEPMLGAKAHSLGSPYPAVWHELWGSLGPCMRRLMAGESSSFDHEAGTRGRDRVPGHASSTFSCGPVRDELGAVRGLVCACVDVDADGRSPVAHEAASEEQRIRQSSAAILRQAHETTARVDRLLALARLTPVHIAKRPAICAVLDDNIPDDAAAAAPIPLSGPVPTRGRDLAPNDL
ncbi:MAG: domain S-box protein [Massilia sp.]|nr:domain S-box protein [Massilia sp.]